MAVCEYVCHNAILRYSLKEFGVCVPHSSFRLNPGTSRTFSKVPLCHTCNFPSYFSILIKPVYFFKVYHLPPTISVKQLHIFIFLPYNFMGTSNKTPCRGIYWPSVGGGGERGGCWRWASAWRPSACVSAALPPPHHTGPLGHICSTAKTEYLWLPSWLENKALSQFSPFP